MHKYIIYLNKRFTHPKLVFILIETSWIAILEVTLQSSSSRWMLKICTPLYSFLVGSSPFISVHFQGQGSIENGIIGIYTCPLNGVFLPCDKFSHLGDFFSKQ